MPHDASHVTARRSKALAQIRDNIADYGCHIYTISGAAFPRYSYTIGLFERFGAELMFPGGSIYVAREVANFINSIADDADSAGLREGSVFNVEPLGTFELGPVDESWAKEMILGAYDYYDRDSIPALQIKPESAHWTIDVPDLAQPWSPEAEPIWRWLYEPWTFPVPESSNAATNLAALRGERVTGAARWEEGEWDLFAGASADAVKEDVRFVPLGTLLAADPSLEAVVSLPVGMGMWRHSDGFDWHSLKLETDEDAP